MLPFLVFFLSLHGGVRCHPALYFCFKQRKHFNSGHVRWNKEVLDRSTTVKKKKKEKKGGTKSFMIFGPVCTDPGQPWSSVFLRRMCISVFAAGKLCKYRRAQHGANLSSLWDVFNLQIPRREMKEYVAAQTEVRSSEIIITAGILTFSHHPPLLEKVCVHRSDNFRQVLFLFFIFLIFFGSFLASCCHDD